MLCTIALCTMHYALCITYMRYAFAHFFPLTCGDKPTNRLCVVTTCADKQTDRPRLSEYNKLSCSSRSLIVSLLKFSNKMSNLLEEYQSESKRYIFLTNLHKCDYFQGLVALSPRVSKDLLLCQVLLFIVGHT